MQRSLYPLRVFPNLGEFFFQHVRSGRKMPETSVRASHSLMEAQQMAKRAFKIALAMTASSFIMVAVAAAQDVNITPQPAPPTGVSAPEAQGAFGPGSQSLWVNASQFAVRLSSTAPVLTYSGHHYYDSPGSVSPTRYFAQLDLPHGAVIEGVFCYAHDAVANNVTFNVQKSTHNIITDVFSTIALASWSTTGTTGYQTPGSGAINEFVAYTQTSGERILYYLSADVAADTAFRGCRVDWHRTVSPAPASATFNDVPVGHPQHRFIQALVASGITGGCGGGNYCPDAPLTRGQMAVFLAAALGLHFSGF